MQECLFLLLLFFAVVYMSALFMNQSCVAYVDYLSLQQEPQLPVAIFDKHCKLDRWVLEAPWGMQHFHSAHKDGREINTHYVCLNKDSLCSLLTITRIWLYRTSWHDHGYKCTARIHVECRSGFEYYGRIYH